ncbi:hypothetical protein BDK51DRAFT_31835 [Blyttiomyces helicus]|uniref:Uncharacterized protein n=1 Tax=Blyttiomyces helicus TaxID=388810 RepID=A0A4P9VXC2_9FUNG|nr:hypothetical protein BDK51DRAFT_31835 [Blyttiomyces helicus]|eukprot:RKO82938.1 hypothetical protein BDK51DRAFT_31835 [Blyttiomyces helicus]
MSIAASVTTTASPEADFHFQLPASDQIEAESEATAALPPADFHFELPGTSITSASGESDYHFVLAAHANMPTPEADFHFELRGNTTTSAPGVDDHLESTASGTAAPEADFHFELPTADERDLVQPHAVSTPEADFHFELPIVDERDSVQPHEVSATEVDFHFVLPTSNGPTPEPQTATESKNRTPAASPPEHLRASQKAMMANKIVAECERVITKFATARVPLTIHPNRRTLQRSAAAVDEWNALLAAVIDAPAAYYAIVQARDTYFDALGPYVPAFLALKAGVRDYLASSTAAHVQTPVVSTSEADSSYAHLLPNARTAEPQAATESGTPMDDQVAARKAMLANGIIEQCDRYILKMVDGPPYIHPSRCTPKHTSAVTSQWSMIIDAVAEVPEAQDAVVRTRDMYFKACGPFVPIILPIAAAVRAYSN